MPEHWFDRLSHHLVQQTSRRQSLGLVAVIAACLATDIAPAVGKTKHRKKSNKGKRGNGTRRKGNQSNNQSPPAPRPGHLGPPDGRDDCESHLDPVLLDDCRAIRRTCQAPDQFCIHGVEISGGDDDRGVACCPSPKTCCRFGCANTKIDRANCGICGIECAEGELCIDGDCLCGDPRGCCSTRQQRCAGQCVDTRTDSNHCNGCGQVCQGGRICVGGRCQCASQWPVECAAGCYAAGFHCCPNGQACEADTYCFEQNGGWGCCPNSWTC